MASAKRELITGIWGRNPSGSRSSSPGALQGLSSGRTPSGG